MTSKTAADVVADEQPRALTRSIAGGSHRQSRARSESSPVCSRFGTRPAALAASLKVAHTRHCPFHESPAASPAGWERRTASAVDRAAPEAEARFT